METPLRILNRTRALTAFRLKSWSAADTPLRLTSEKIFRRLRGAWSSEAASLSVVAMVRSSGNRRRTVRSGVQERQAAGAAILARGQDTSRAQFDRSPSSHRPTESGR